MARLNASRQCPRAETVKASALNEGKQANRMMHRRRETPLSLLSERKKHLTRGDSRFRLHAGVMSDRGDAGFFR